MMRQSHPERIERSLAQSRAWTVARTQNPDFVPPAGGSAAVRSDSASAPTANHTGRAATIARRRMTRDALRRLPAVSTRLLASCCLPAPRRDRGPPAGPRGASNRCAGSPQPERCWATRRSGRQTAKDPRSGPVGLLWTPSSAAAGRTRRRRGRRPAGAPGVAERGPRSDGPGARLLVLGLPEPRGDAGIWEAVGSRRFHGLVDRPGAGARRGRGDSKADVGARRSAAGGRAAAGGHRGRDRGCGPAECGDRGGGPRGPGGRGGAPGWGWVEALMLWCGVRRLTMEGPSGDVRVGLRHVKGDGAGGLVVCSPCAAAPSRTAHRPLPAAVTGRPM